MRKVLGAGIAAAGGALEGYAIARIVLDPFSSIDSLGTLIALPILGVLLMIGAAFATRWAMGIAPVAALLAGGAVVWQQDPGLLTRHLGLTLVVALGVLAGPLILGALAVWSRSRRQQAARLVATGHKGVAQVQGSSHTGVHINGRPQLQVEYLVHPLDGSAPFPHTKRQLLDHATGPLRPGMRLPVWYDPADRSKVAVGMPTDLEAVATLREFGIEPAEAFGQPAGPATAPSA